MKLIEKKKVIQYKNNRENKKPLLSVSVVTYQHVNFIKQCLDGILMQKTNFDFEILLGEDVSTDGTRKICIEYAEKYQDKIRLFLHHRENNIKIGGQPTGRFNMLYNLQQAKGKYIALCEGDDYWTDPLKLQKQVDFLENNEEFSVCFHPVFILNEETQQKTRSNINTPRITKTIDLIKGNYIHTPSVVYKNTIKELPKWFLDSPIGDWPLHILNSKYGKIKMLKETMSVYRMHLGGIFSTKTKWTIQKEIEFQNGMINLYKNLKNEFSSSEDYKKILNKKITSSYNNLRINFCLTKQTKKAKELSLAILKINKINILFTKLGLSVLLNVLFVRLYAQYIRGKY